MLYRPEDIGFDDVCYIGHSVLWSCVKIAFSRKFKIKTLQFVNICRVAVRYVCMLYIFHVLLCLVMLHFKTWFTPPHFVIMCVQ